MRAVRQCDAERIRCGEAGADAVEHFDPHPGGAQPFGLFAAAPEDERIAALQAHHAFAGARLRNHHLLDQGLRRAAAAAALADPHDAGRLAGAPQDLRADQIVDQQHARGTDRAQRFQGQQFGIAGAGADQRHAAGGEGEGRKRQRRRSGAHGRCSGHSGHSGHSSHSRRRRAIGHATSGTDSGSGTQASARSRHSTCLASGAGAGVSPLTTDWI